MRGQRPRITNTILKNWIKDKVGELMLPIGSSAKLKERPELSRHQSSQVKQQGTKPKVTETKPLNTCSDGIKPEAKTGEDANSPVSFPVRWHTTSQGSGGSAQMWGLPHIEGSLNKRLWIFP